MKRANRTLLNRNSLIYSLFRSIAFRLTLFYTFCTFIIIFIATIFLYWTLKNNLELDEKQFLSDEINVVVSLLVANPDNNIALNEEVKLEAAVHKYVKYYTRVLDDKGDTLIETTKMSNILDNFIFPESNGMQTDAVKWKSSDNKMYLLMSALVELPSVKKRYIQIALDITHEETLIANYRHYVVIVLFSAIFLSTASGIFIARKGLIPLTSIAKVAQNISVTKLHERIGESTWPIELTILTKEFDDMLKRLEDSFSRLNHISADLAHELRSPINNLIGETEVTLTRLRTPEEYRQVLVSNQEEFSRLSRMIDNLLFLARAENMETLIEKIWFDIDKKIEEVCEFYEVIAEEKCIEIYCHGYAKIYGDPTLFKRALSNILLNALQYAPQYGTITITMNQAMNQFVEVNVKNTGCGIDDVHISKIFDRFYRSEYARSQHPDGTGLGLAIVKSIMELHGGSVSVDGKSFNGTLFTLRFPLPN